LVVQLLRCFAISSLSRLLESPPAGERDVDVKGFASLEDGHGLLGSCLVASRTSATLTRIALPNR
jgi:hypothetical protein